MASAPAHAGTAFTRFLNHPAGPKTIHFWAPAMKWGLVIAGLGDLSRPADKLSMTQTVALAATGIIWSRYSLVITPKNWSLFSVNVFVGATGLYQLYRIWEHKKAIGAAQPTASTATQISKNI
ncbi:putative FMP43-protein found in mitochondrial proteome [Gaertneriomyces semiglobifer]|nr:putative FMP43-protein found in mitochondrial proteome [Gaertneriomyces semiglobifer]